MNQATPERLQYDDLVRLADSNSISASVGTNGITSFHFTYNGARCYCLCCSSVVGLFGFSIETDDARQFFFPEENTDGSGDQTKD